LKGRFGAPLLMALSLAAGCASLPSPPARPAVYDFGPGALTTTPATRHTLPPIALPDVKAPPALDSAAVLYRLAYSDAQQLRPYAQARWSMPPGQLVQQRLRESLSLTRAVVGPGESDVPLALRVELHEFSQLFDTPQTSSGLVRLRATLVDIKGGADRLVAQQVFVVQRPAASADAPGGVRALMAATDAAVEEIAAWLQRQPAK
jgi:cholesterol transport system auxiliary component